MPRRLNRKEYGWSYTYGKGQRTNSDEYMENFDKIRWERHDTSEWDTKQTQFGKARTKRF